MGTGTRRTSILYGLIADARHSTDHGEHASVPSLACLPPGGIVVCVSIVRHHLELR